jgi:hypothetical protein
LWIPATALQMKNPDGTPDDPGIGKPRVGVSGSAE